MASVVELLIKASESLVTSDETVTFDVASLDLVCTSAEMESVKPVLGTNGCGDTLQGGLGSIQTTMLQDLY